MWKPLSKLEDWTEITTTSHTTESGTGFFEVPSAVLQTVVTPVNSSQLKLYWGMVDPFAKDPGYLVNLHFCEIMNLTKNEKREFNITLNDAIFYNESLSPDYLYLTTIYNTKPVHGSEEYNVTLSAIKNSTLPPILNAIELFIVLPISDILTDSVDVSAV